MRVVLRVNAGRNAGQEIPIRVERFLIGRADDCHLRANSSAISRYHCAVFVEDENVSVRDYGSRNGTFVNETRITERRPLQDGDHLKVGPLHFVVIMLDQQPTGHDTQPSATGETSLEGKLNTTLRSIMRLEPPTQEVEIMDILSQPLEPQREVAKTRDPVDPPPAETPPEEPKSLPKPKRSRFLPPDSLNPADAAIDGLKRLFTPKKQ